MNKKNLFIKEFTKCCMERRNLFSAIVFLSRQALAKDTIGVQPLAHKVRLIRRMLRPFTPLHN